MNILITGASRGIGFETAHRFSINAQHKVIAISRNMEGLQRLKEKSQEINKTDNLIALPFDLSNIYSTGNTFLNKIKDHMDTVDILINNAGYLVKKAYEELTKEDFERLFDINLFSPSHLIRVIMPMMKVNGAHVVNIGSMGGFQGSLKFPGLSYYSASKAALACLTECLSTEFKDSSVRFNYLALGSVQTEMLSEAFPGYKAPLSAEEMAEFIVDFAINGGKYMNGKVIPVSITNP